MFPESSHYWSCCLKIFLSPLKHARWSEKSLAHVKNWYHYQPFKRNPKKYSLFHWFPLSLRAHIVFILFKVMLKFCFLLKWSDSSWRQKMIFLRPGLFPDVRKKLYLGLIRLPDVESIQVLGLQLLSYLFLHRVLVAGVSTPYLPNSVLATPANLLLVNKPQVIAGIGLI